MTLKLQVPGQRTRWFAFDSAQALHAAAADRILAAAARAVSMRGRFLIVLSGGDTPRKTYELLRGAHVDWHAWHVYFGDERCLPRDDPARNSLMAAAAWLDHVQIPPTQVHVIPAELGPGIGAARYRELMRTVGSFDLVLLGLGEDGHTASLFPQNRDALEAGAPDVVAVHDAPKPPPQRVTLSAQRLDRTAEALFLVDGASKQAAVRRWRAGESIPASAIDPGTVVDVLVSGVRLEAGRIAERHPPEGA